MSNDGTMRYNFAALADATAAHVSFSQELEQIRQEALHELAGIHQYFDTEHGSPAYAQCQNQINEGIDQGQQCIRQQGDAIDTSAMNYGHTDQGAAGAFSGL